ncbi:MAG: M48 family metalloprotease [Ignavibacteriae bacterium]|nr:M48 family metalloprotease [Ignavibacteria bacterium]MBI3365732.1 M48 family metalloprotease [Ignavibacteriota bacterium]
MTLIETFGFTSRFLKRHVRRLLHYGVLGIFGAGLILTVLTGCAVNPVTGERQFSLISEDQEIQMGKEADEQIVASLGLYPDQDLQRYVSDLGMKLAASSERPNLPWTFRVVDDPVVNAFAIPGGHVYITRGILAHLENEAELAGVMGHEVGHVTAKHSVSQMSKQQLAQLGLGVGMILKPELQQYGQLASAGLGVLFLKFGRDAENQADALGVRYSNRLGYDPHQLISVMTTLDRVTQAAGGRGTPEWLSTHPDPGNRKENIKAQIDTLRPGTVGNKVVRDPYLKQIDNVIFGQNPREGFFKGNMFLQPDLKFRFEFPDGWKTQNQKQSVIGVSANQDAAIQITLAKEKTADAAARAFFSQQGISADGTRSSNVHGFSASAGNFTAQTDQGAMQGTVMFVEYGGNVYQILGYGSQQSWSNYESAARKSIGSFDKLTDPKVLNVQPQRLKIVKIDRAMTLEQFNQRYPSAVSMDILALINEVQPGGLLKAGQEVKQVVGEKFE